MDKKDFSTPIDLKRIAVTDSFWHREQELVRTEVIPYQWDALNDRIEGAEPSYCMHNFKAAGRLMKRKQEKGADFEAPAYTYRGFAVFPEKGKEDPDTFYGFVFQDTDFSKWIEAVGYSLTWHPDPELEKTADEAIDIVCAAQAENGYLDTYYIINGMDRAFTNLQDHHELYCLGHLVEGAVAYYQATGKDKLLKAACRYADYVAEYFGPEEGQCKGYPGHEIAEMALVRLYEVTGEEKYLKVSRFFLDQRGQEPLYFEEEGKARAEYEGREYKPNPEHSAYYQADLPVREQSEAVGHAVRAVYLYSGMADVARLTEDEKMQKACQRLWDNITKEKLYITGGIGGTVHGEAFSYNYDLPNDAAYSETCAAIGLAFFARRMLEIKADARYADVMEQALYNTVLSGMALDGKSFFYVNPLEVVPIGCHKDKRLEHVKPIRQKWFGCACCPPNIARIVSSVAAYAYTEAEDCFYTHLYMGSRLTTALNGTALSVTVDTDMPFDGQVKMTLGVLKEEKAEGTLAFRIPGWSGEAKVVLLRTEGSDKLDLSALKDGERIDSATGIRARMEAGYLYLTGSWQDGDTIALTFPMEVHMKMATPKVREDMDKVAFVRGPITYCMEEADNTEELHLYRVDLNRIGNQCEKVELETWDELGHEMTLLKVPGLKRKKAEENALYMDYQPPMEEEVTMTFLPYYAWANRGEGEMKVWIRV